MNIFVVANRVTHLRISYPARRVWNFLRFGPFKKKACQPLLNNTFHFSDSILKRFYLKFKRLNLICMRLNLMYKKPCWFMNRLNIIDWLKVVLKTIRCGEIFVQIYLMYSKSSIFSFASIIIWKHRENCFYICVESISFFYYYNNNSMKKMYAIISKLYFYMRCVHIYFIWCELYVNSPSL